MTTQTWSLQITDQDNPGQRGWLCVVNSEGPLETEWKQVVATNGNEGNSHVFPEPSIHFH